MYNFAPIIFPLSFLPLDFALSNNDSWQALALLLRQNNYIEESLVIAQKKEEFLWEGRIAGQDNNKFSVKLWLMPRTHNTMIYHSDKSLGRIENALELTNGCLVMVNYDKENNERTRAICVCGIDFATNSIYISVDNNGPNVQRWPLDRFSRIWSGHIMTIYPKEEK